MPIENSVLVTSHHGWTLLIIVIFPFLQPLLPVTRVQHASSTQMAIKDRQHNILERARVSPAPPTVDANQNPELRIGTECLLHPSGQPNFKTINACQVGP